MQVQPYLWLEGRAEEAIAFYQQAVGAEVTMMMRNREAPDKPPPGMLPPGSEEKIMHASLKVGGSEVLISDGVVSGNPTFKGVSLTLTDLSVAEAERYFAALSEGGEVQMPLGRTFFAKSFGMLTDRFGVSWLIAAM